MLKLLNRFLLALLLLAGIGGTAAAERRVALVIGNAAYANIAPLEMPLNDAHRVSGILKGLGFEVILGTDATRQDLEQLAERFGAALIGADVGFFFFSGHGFQTSQPGQHHPVNHIVPVDFDVRSRDIARATLPLDTIVQALRRVRVGFIFMDACRDDPTLKAASAEQARGARGITLERGLGRVELGPEVQGNSPKADTVTRPAGMVIAYSTEPGKLALDSNKGTLSPFTTALVKHMGTPGQSIQDMLGRVSAEVAIDTKGKQTPWNVASLTAGAYQLVPKQAAPPSPEPPRKAAPASTRPKPAPAPAPARAEPKAKVPFQLP